MLPAESVYGEWPESGEIDLVESRGNSGLNYTADGGGRNTVISTLHWGLNFLTDMFEQTTWADTLRRGDYSDSFHTFGLEWSEDYMYVYVDNRLATSVYVKFGPQLGTMWQRGRFEELGYLE